MGAALLLVLRITLDGGVEPSAPPAVTVPLKAEPSRQIPFDPEDDAAAVWLARCSTCHGKNGKGNKKAGGRNGARDVTSDLWQADRSDEEILTSIQDGLPGTKMQAFATHGSASQLDGLVALIRSLRDTGAAAQ